jgi:hypothetical protein
MVTFTVTKDPDAYLDYGLDWSDWLGTDTISVSTWLVSGGDGSLVVDDEINSSTGTTAWVEGGTVGSTYLLTNRITTVAGRIDDRSIVFTIRER